MLRFYISSIFNLEFKIYLVVYFIIFVIFLLNKAKFIEFHPFLLKALVVSLGIGIFGMFIHGLILILRKKKNIDKELKDIYQGEVEADFTNDQIIVKAKDYTNHYKLIWSNIKKVKVIKNTMHLVPKSKNEQGVRINKNEIIEGNFNELIYVHDKNFIRSISYLLTPDNKHFER